MHNYKGKSLAWGRGEAKSQPGIKSLQTVDPFVRAYKPVREEPTQTLGLIVFGNYVYGI